MRVLGGGKGRIYQLALSRDGRYLVASRAGPALELWDLTRGEMTPLHQRHASLLCFGADGRLYEDGIFGPCVHDFAAKSDVPLFGKRRCRPFTLTADGTEMVVVSDIAGRRPPKLQRFLLGGKLRKVWEASLPRVEPLQLALSADGGTVAYTYTSSDALKIAIRDGNTGKSRHTLEIQGPAQRVWVNRSGSQIAILNVTQIVVWDPAAGEAIHKFNPEDGKLVADWADEPTGTRLATAGRTFVRFWDTATWRETAAFDWKIGPVTAVALAADGTLAAAGGEKGAIVVWDLDG